MRTALALICALALLATDAQAASIQADYELAAGYWQDTPACGEVHVETLPPGVEAESVIGDADEETCTLRIATWTFPYERCVLALHEYGHLLGLEHSPDPRSVMYALVGEQRVGVCVAQYRREGWTRCRARATRRRLCAEIVAAGEPWIYGY